MNRHRITIMLIATAFGFVAMTSSMPIQAQLFPRLRERIRPPFAPVPPPLPPLPRRMPSGNLYQPSTRPSPGLRPARPVQPRGQLSGPTPTEGALQPSQPSSGLSRQPSGAENAEQNRNEVPDPFGRSILQTGDPSRNSAATAPAMRDRGRGSLAIMVRQDPDSATGLFVTDFFPHSLAEQAGLQKDDRIIAIDGSPTPTIESVAEIIRGKAPGDEVAVRVERGKLTGDLTIPLVPSEPFSEDEETASVTAASSPQVSLADVGLEVTDASEDRGTVVSQVSADSIAQRSGLQVGDRIVSVNDVFVASVATFQQQLARWDRSQPIGVQLVRNERLFQVALDPRLSGSAKNDAPTSDTSVANSAESQPSEESSIFNNIGSAIGGFFGGSNSAPPKQRETLPQNVDVGAEPALPQRERELEPQVLPLPRQSAPSNREDPMDLD